MHIRNLLLGATIVTPALLPAQEFYRPEPEVYKNELTIGVSVTNSVDVSFRSGGFASSSTSALFTADADGNAALYGVSYPTGTIYADSEYYETIVDDNDTPDDDSDDTSSVVFNGITEDANGDAWTGYFNLFSSDQLGYFDGDGNFVSDNLSRDDVDYYVYQSSYYAEASDPVVYDQTDSYNPGIDVNYTRYFDDKGRFAVIVGFTTHGVQSSGVESQEAVITENRTYYEADFDNALEIDEDDNPYGSYSGVYTRVDEDDEDGRNLINLRNATSDSIIGSGLVSSDWEVDVGYYDFRIGAQFQFYVSRKWSMKLAAGASATYVDSTFRLFTQLYPDGIDEDSDFDFDNGQSTYNEDSESDIIYGGWGSADIVYNINRRVSWSFGANFQTGDTYEHVVTGTFVGETVDVGSFSVDIGNTMAVRSSVSFKF